MIVGARAARSGESSARLRRASSVQRTKSNARKPPSTTMPRPDSCGADDLVDGRRRAHLAAERDDAPLERVDQRLVAALGPAHHLAAGTVARRRHAPRARPDVRRGQVVVAAVELRVEQRLPEALDDAPAARATEPVEERDVVEVVVGLLSAGSGRRTAPGAADRAAAGEGTSRNSFGDVIEKQPPVAVEADLRRPEAEGVAEPELLGEADHAVVRRQDDVVEAIDSVAVEVERADEPAEVRRALEDARPRTPACAEPVRRREPEDAAADDGDGSARLTPAPAVARWRNIIRQ